MKERLVVIGGGFAGLNLVKHVDKEKYDVVLIDRNNFHSFPPLFYQVASSGLEPASILFPFRREIRKMSRRPTYHIGQVKTIDLAEKRVITPYETLPYDKLVIAAGTTNNFFNIPQIDQKVFTIKSAGEAIRCRNEILSRLERASIMTDTRQKGQLLSFVVVGGGPTGVEIAGAIGEMKRYILQREYPDIEPDKISITLVEGTDRLLSAMSETASRYALKYITQLDVDVRLGVTMTAYDNETVTLSDNTSLPAGMLVWTAGVTSVSFDTIGGKLPLGPGGRIIVDEFNRVKGLDDIFAVGDISLYSDEQHPRGYPQLAQVAIQQARNLARNLNSGTMSKPFHYNDKGSMATIGRNRAVADLKHMHLVGWTAWMAWMFIHLISLLGMRNKLVVLTNWVWAYFSYPTSLRLLIQAARFPRRHTSD